jgi:hypothetical protein
MKKILVILLILCVPVMKICAQNIPAADNTLIDNYIKSVFSVEKVRINSDTLAKVFAGSFYEVTPGYVVKGGSSTCGVFRLMIKNGKMVEIEELDTAKKLEVLFSLLNPSFSLKNANDAKIFETALDKIYPLDWSDQKYKEHKKINNKWYFIRGDFFGSKTAIMLTVNAASKITSIDFDLEAIKKQ